jgi:hypothetical protein
MPAIGRRYFMALEPLKRSPWEGKKATIITTAMETIRQPFTAPSIPPPILLKIPGPAMPLDIPAIHPIIETPTMQAKKTARKPMT